MQAYMLKFIYALALPAKVAMPEFQDNIAGCGRVFLFVGSGSKPLKDGSVEVIN